MNAAHDGKKGALSISTEADQPVRPLVWVSAGVTSAMFISLFAFATWFSDNWFVQRFLDGTGLVVAAILLLVLNAIVVSLIESYLERRKREIQNGNSDN
jgi:hypothetical protein